MQWAANLKRRLAFRRPEFTPTRKSPITEYAAIALFYSVGKLLTGADLMGGHSCSGQRGPWEAGPWRPPGLGGPGRLNFGLQLQSPDCNLNWIYDLFKLETSKILFFQNFNKKIS